MKTHLADMLVCPSCLPLEIGLHLRVEQEAEGDILQGRLTCGHCGQDFPIQDGLADLDPGREDRPRTGSKYEKPTVLSSYLWSHFGDILQDEQASEAYGQWAELVHPHSGMCLDIGTAVGRFAFDMAQKCDFVIGLDNSVTFIRAARELMLHRQKALSLPDEGRLMLEDELHLPKDWTTANVEFIVADAQALPFRSNIFSSAASLNMVDKVPRPLVHLTESNRVVANRGAQFLLSDPFSWSEEAAREEDWLGGLDTGPYAGHGLQNIIAMLQNGHAPLHPQWSIEHQGHVWWKIRTHSNHFELIRSCCVKASR
jgi:uncharacterized protein YbaR (Trm112 family)